MRVSSMKNVLAVTSGVLLVGCMSAFAQSSITAYNNTTNDLRVRFNPGTAEVGDQIILSPLQATKVTAFSFQYWLTGATGSEKAQVKFYANDGAVYGSGTSLMPGTVLFDSGLFGITGTERSVLTFDGSTDAAFLSGVNVPASFTYSVQFSSLGVGANAGLDIYNGCSVGGNYTDYWQNTGSTWELRTGANNMDFAATLQVVPEPGTYALFGLGLTVLGFVRSRYGKNK